MAGDGEEWSSGARPRCDGALAVEKDRGAAGQASGGPTTLKRGEKGSMVAQTRRNSAAAEVTGIEEERCAEEESEQEVRWEPMRWVRNVARKSMGGLYAREKQ